MKMGEENIISDHSVRNATTMQSTNDDRHNNQSQEQSQTGNDDARSVAHCEPSDTSKYSNEKNKLNEFNYSGSEVNKRPKTICYDYKKGLCRRRFCRVSAFNIHVIHRLMHC